MSNTIARLSLAASLIAGACIGPTASAADHDGMMQADKPRHFTLGVGQWGTRSPVEGTSHDVQTGMFPWVSYDSERLTIDPSGVAFTVLGTSRLEFDALLSPRWQLADPEEGELHDDLRRRTGLDVGGRVKAEFGATSVSLSYRADASGRIDGHELTAEGGYSLPLPAGGLLAFRSGALWRDSTLNTYLYGVFADEVRADRPAYRIGQGITPFAGLSLGYPLNSALSASVSVEAQYLSKEVGDSPIIARRLVPSAMAGIFYTF